MRRGGRGRGEGKGRTREPLWRGEREADSRARLTSSLEISVLELDGLLSRGHGRHEAE
jgi:hypothetical protein